jgi:uncharacterized delta-60 repeat protein
MTVLPGCTGKCLQEATLARVNSDGTVASTFGGAGLVKVDGSVEALSPPAVDPEGRPLIATSVSGAVTVHRYLPDGSPDPSFGSGGATTFACGCGTPRFTQLRLAIDAQGRTVVAVANLAFSGESGQAAVARLLPGGAVDAGFGGGVVQLGVQSGARGIGFGSGGAVYLWGAGCCTRVGYLHRVSAKGQIDTAFDARSDTSLANVAARGVLTFEQSSLVPRPHGFLDLYAGEGLLRLRSNGSVEGKFASGGVKTLPIAVTTAIPVGNERTLALGYDGMTGEAKLARFGTNGGLDRSFGSAGTVPVEGLSGEGELGLAHLRGRRALVSTLGESFCRTSCEARPTLVRYRLAPKN